MRRVSAACMLVLAVAASGCRVRDPVANLGGCLVPAIEELKRDGGRSTVTCDLITATRLIASPGRAVTVVVLTAAGVSPNVAEILVPTALGGSR